MSNSMGLNFIKSIKNSFKKLELDLFSDKEIIRKTNLSFSDRKLKSFNDLISWKGDDIPPTFPYAIQTHIQFSIVNDKHFPFSPFGLIHKTEHIKVLKPLKEGEWKLVSKLASIEEVETGYEVKIFTELFIDGELSWTSETIAFKRVSFKMNKKQFEPTKITNEKVWNIPNGSGMKYGLLSHNVDLIHVSNITAKMMGHRSAIMHGMWTVARGISEFEPLEYPFEIKVKFLVPIYMPAKVVFQKTEDGFGVYSTDGSKTHLLATLY